MRIYRINIEHEDAGLNWSRFDIASKGFAEALAKATKRLRVKEKIESIELIAAETE